MQKVTVIEKHLSGKINNESCEDFIIINDGFIAVIDGATAKGDPLLYFPKTSGRIAGEIISEVLEDNNNWYLDSISLFDKINESIILYYKNRGLFEHVSYKYEDRLIASVVIFSIYHREVWSLGDCQFLLNDKLYNNHKKSDLVVSQIRKLIIESLLSQGISYDEIQKDLYIRELIVPILRVALPLSNQNTQEFEFAYGVMDGFWSKEKKLEIYKITSIISTIILATDGYPFLQMTLEESEQSLKDIYKKDPLLLTLPGALKSFNHLSQSYDDRAYVKIAL